MRQALGLARMGLGKTHPNPAVGCIIVKDGVVVGEGYHPRAGEPHAEVFALRAAGELASTQTGRSKGPQYCTWNSESREVHPERKIPLVA